ncbi:hypothetical protein [Roseibium sp.]|uniref:hypothetical protein n=1 Tax=Roseibium sp. TaxID=1936156 RepID=UPI003BAF945C
MDHFEKYQDLCRLLASCNRDQFKAREQLLRDSFEEKAMKRRFFGGVNLPPLNPNMTWNSTRKALLKKPFLRTFYLAENRSKLYELLQVETPDALLRREKSIRDKIDQLPPVEVKKTELRAGSERTPDSKIGTRVYLELPDRSDFDGPKVRGHSREAHVAVSLDEYAALTSRYNEQELYVSSISRSCHFAENSHISTEERAVQGYRDEVCDHTRLSISLLLSQKIFQTIDALSKDWFSGATETDKRTVLLTIDVPSDTHLLRRKLGKGEGVTFRAIECREKKLDGFHLHLLDGAKEATRSFAFLETAEAS